MAESVRMAEQALDLLRLPPASRDTVLFLIAHHLRVSQIAFRRELGRPRLVVLAGVTSDAEHDFAPEHVGPPCDGGPGSGVDTDVEAGRGTRNRTPAGHLAPSGCSLGDFTSCGPGPGIGPANPAPL